VTICAKHDGRSILECTRSLSNCPCALELLKEARRVCNKPINTVVPRWITSWPDWYGIHGNVEVVPASDYDALSAAPKPDEQKKGDPVDELVDGWTIESDRERLKQALKFARSLARQLREAQRKGSCVWYEDGEGSFWATGCGQAFTLNDGTPAENGMKYCYHCGLEIDAATLPATNAAQTKEKS